MHGQSLTQPLYKQGRAINEDDGKLFVFARLDVGYTLSGNPLRNLVDVQEQPPIWLRVVRTVLRRHNGWGFSRRERELHFEVAIAVEREADGCKPVFDAAVRADRQTPPFESQCVSKSLYRVPLATAT